MSEKFRGKYRIPSARLQIWDYGWNGSYFVTICTGHRICYFGYIQSGIMHLSETGLIAHKLWQDIPVHFPFVQLSEFVVMPNHVHGIITINKQQRNTESMPVDGGGIDGGRDIVDTVETQNFASLQSKIQSKNRFGPQSQNLASIIRGFKTGVTKFARITNPGFQWQSRYHDHIIRNNGAFEQIRNYIIDNPAKWEGDDFFLTRTNCNE